MAAVLNKKYYSPYVHIKQANMISAITGIFDTISYATDTATDDISIDIIPLGSSSAVTVKMSSGDTLYGPFTSVKAATIASDNSLIIHERSKSI